MVRALIIDVKQATGGILCSTEFRAGKLPAKGHLISQKAAPMRQTAATPVVLVSGMEEDDKGADEAIRKASAEAGRRPPKVNLASGQRANLFAIEPGCTADFEANQQHRHRCGHNEAGFFFATDVGRSER